VDNGADASCTYSYSRVTSRYSQSLVAPAAIRQASAVCACPARALTQLCRTSHLLPFTQYTRTTFTSNSSL